MNDNGRVNQKILASLLKKSDPLKKLESAYRTYPTTFRSPDVKRLYLRFFESTALQLHYIEVIARVERALGAEVAEKCENHLNEQLKILIDEVDKAIDAGEALKQANGLTQDVNFLPEGLVVDVRVTSPIMRQFLILMEKTEQMITLLETLRIDGVITTPMCDTRRGQLKAQIKNFNRAARQLAKSLRSRVEDAHRPPATATSKARRNRTARAVYPGAAAPGNGSGGATDARQPERPGNGSGDAADGAIKDVQDQLRTRWRPVAEPRQKQVAVS